MTDELDAQVLAKLEEYVKSVDFSLPGIECFTVANKTFRVMRSSVTPTIWIIPVLEEKEQPIKIIMNEQQEVDFIKRWWGAHEQS